MTIIGIVGEVNLDCGCYAQVALGKARLMLTDSRHISAHTCSTWKQHKYALAEAEHKLAEQLKRRFKRLKRC